MLEKIIKANSLYELFKDGKDIIVAVSGGADSMALLHALKSLSDRYGFKVSAAHFNHQIRGEEANRDENFVKEFCLKQGIELYCKSENVPQYANENSISIELAARRLRYKFFEEICGDSLIATAHHAGDNLETMLFNLIRGTALSGLCGIPAKRDNYIRPLLLCTREDIEKYCRENLIEFVTDSSNLSDEYTRNYLRQQVVPKLKEVQESAELSAARTAFSLREDEDYLTEISNSEFFNRFSDGKLCLKDFEKLHKALAKRVLKKYFITVTAKDADFLHITELYDICINGGKRSLPGNFMATVNGGFLKISLCGDTSDTHFEVSIEEVLLNSCENKQKVNNLLLNNSFDCDKIVGKLVIRTREEGDSVRIKGRGGTKTLKKLYNEYKIPIEDRKNLPVICDDKGIVWIDKIGVAERCATTRNTKKVYYVKSVAF